MEKEVNDLIVENNNMQESVVEDVQRTEVESISEGEQKLGKMYKIREILNKGSLLSILPLLTSKEEREEFIDIVSEAYGDRINQLFWQRLEQECAETPDETKKRRDKEDIDNLKSIEEARRSKDNRELRTQMNETISELTNTYSSGGFITESDKNLLETYGQEALSLSQRTREVGYRGQQLENNKILGDINFQGEMSAERYAVIEQIRKLVERKREIVRLRSLDSNVGFDDEEEKIDKDIEVLKKSLEQLDDTIILGQNNPLDRTTKFGNHR